MTAEKVVTQIPQRIMFTAEKGKRKLKKRRTAAYSRVSTDDDEQLNSFEAQMDYYKNYIQQNPDLEFVGMYADEGISGTSTKKREGFNRMVEDALNGKIEYIITKC